MAVAPRALTEHTKNWLMVVPLVVLVNLLIMVGSSSNWWDISWYRADIMQGQVWRVMTGHFQHLGWNHWLMNQLGFALILWLLPMLVLKFRWLLACAVGAVSIGSALLLTDIEGYVGLSGILYLLLCYGTLIDKTIPIKIKTLLLSVVLLKVAVEQFWPELNSSTEAYIGGFVAIDAHLFGSFIGIGMALAERGLSRLRSKGLPAEEGLS
ncbi:rhombosortase [Litoribacillus peritrichatus]|uniref:Peptidase S54 rhomboid domain-containing protein n=1 Tax=Litoribacillus peritrichatus TaxID=718191 RepID=A0ABP7NER4_9GAMM